MNLTEVLQQTLESARALVGASQGALGVAGPDGEPTVRVRAGSDTTSNHDDSDADAELIRRATRTGRPVRRRSPEAVLATPIRVRGEAVGALCLRGKPHGDQFSDHDEAIAAALADAASVAVDDARQLEQARQRQHWLAASNAVTDALLAGEKSSSALARVAEFARIAADARGAAIAQPSEDDTLLRFNVVDTGDDRSSSLVGIVIPVENTATGRAFTTGRPVVVRDYGRHVFEQHPDLHDQLPAMVKELDSAIAAPLTVGDKRLGALTVVRFADDVPFSDVDVELVERFASHVALTIEFSGAAEDRRRLAVLEDRHRIARDLHDVVIQRLYAAGLRLYSMTGKMDQPDLARRVTQVVDDLDGVVQDIRTSIFALQEPAAARPDLRSELWHVVHEFAEVLGFEPWVNLAGPLDSAIPDSIRPDLAAAVREALSNVARHAGATSVYVDISVDDNGERLTLTVADNGAGRAGRPSRRGGLANLAARAERWGGTFSLRQSPGRGAKLVWSITLPRAAAVRQLRPSRQAHA